MDGTTHMNAPEVSRVSTSDLTTQRFLEEYVALNRPVVVTGALEPWDVDNRWTPAAMDCLLGGHRVQVYNNYFDLQTIITLRQYFSRNFGKRAIRKDVVIPYVRWYTRLRDAHLDFCWADHAFSKLQSYWSLPEFLPNKDYLLPHMPRGIATTTPVTDPFPAKGLFISPAGARTSLHVDPWGSCAILCQLYGQKTWYMYAPDQAEYLRNELGVVDVTRPDERTFPEFKRAQLTAKCCLSPGEVIYVPHGWYHQVECASDSISITWNFVHKATASSLLEWLTQGVISESDESVLRFFYNLPASHPDVAGHVRALVNDALQ
jgi:hypothetical protein